MAKRAALLLSLLVVLLSACPGAGESHLVRLWSQTPDILPFVDRYNAGQQDYKVEVAYLPSPADEILIAQEVPDLVLSERLSAPRCAAKLEGLGPLVNQAGLDPRTFYQQLLSSQQSGGAITALPFSFNLPVVIFNRDLFPSGAPDELSLEQLMSLGKTYNKTDKNRLTALGFSPLWNRGFLFHTATLFEVDFHAGSDLKLSWNQAALDTWLQYLVAWTDQQNGGFDRESEFIRTYLYEPPYQLAGRSASETRRIAFYQALVRDYFLIPTEKRSRLAMAWLTRSEKIPADEGILFFGVPKGVHNRPGAYDFLKWTCTAQTQNAVLKDNAAANPGAFGIGGGFSTLPQVNETFLPEMFPFLAGRVPDASRIIFPSPLPETWEKIKTEVLLSWIYDHFQHKKDIPPLQAVLP